MFHLTQLSLDSVNSLFLHSCEGLVSSKKGSIFFHPSFPSFVRCLFLSPSLIYSLNFSFSFFPSILLSSLFARLNLSPSSFFFFTSKCFVRANFNENRVITRQVQKKQKVKRMPGARRRNEWEIRAAYATRHLQFPRNRRIFHPLFRFPWLKTGSIDRSTVYFLNGPRFSKSIRFLFCFIWEGEVYSSAISKFLIISASFNIYHSMFTLPKY